MKSRYLLFLLCIPVTVFAQGKKDTLKVDDFYVDFAVPDLAAYTLLGIDNDQVSRPGNLKELAIGLSSLTGTNGKFNPSIGIEYSPFITLNKNLKTETNNDKSYWDRRFRPTNLALTFGTQIDDSLGNRAALGFKWVPVDFSEPLGDKEFYKAVQALLSDEKGRREIIYTNAFNNKVLDLLSDTTILLKGKNPPEKKRFTKEEIESLQRHLEITKTEYRTKLLMLDSSGTIGSIKAMLKDSVRKEPAYALIKDSVKQVFEEYIEEFVDFIYFGRFRQEPLGDKIRKLKEEFKKTHWNALVVQFSAGWVWNSDSATFDDLSKEKYVAFIGVSTPLWFKSRTWAARHTQAIAQIQYTNDKSKLTAFASKFSAGGRILIGNSDNRLSLEGMYSDITYDAKKTDGSEIRETSFRWAIGGEFKLSQGSWLEIALGGQKLINGETRILPSFSLKHALQNKRRFD